MADSRDTSVAVVVWADADRDVVLASLESVRHGIAPGDRIVVLHDQADRRAGRALASLGWVEPRPTRRRPAFGDAVTAARDAGGTASPGEVTILVSGRVVLGPDWRTAALDALAGGATAAGPRVANLDGDQGAGDADYPGGDVLRFRRAARAWSEHHAGSISPIAALTTLCVALTHASLEALNVTAAETRANALTASSFPTTAGSAQLVVADGWYTHLAGDGAGRWGASRGTDLSTVRPPLLSASLIVKNEEAVLGECLASLDGFVDEIVVYDTGSTDATIAIARAAGATVIEGYWDDDFARARNASLEACRGRWVIAVDADEVVEGDTAGLRRLLSTDPMFDVGAVHIRNLSGDKDATSVALSHYMGRLVRNGVGRWQNRLHEKLVEVPGRAPVRVEVIRDISLLHSGYVAEVVTARDKTNRNIRIAEADLESADADHRDELALNLARSLMWAYRHAEALPMLDAVRTSTSATPSQRRGALRHGVETLLTLGRPADALEWIDELRESSSDQQMAQFFEGTARLMLGENEEAARLFDGVEKLLAEDGLEFNESNLHAKRGIARSALEDWSAAADLLAEAASDPVLSEPIWAPLVNAWWMDGRDPAALAVIVPESRFHAVVAQAVFAKAEAADALAEALWAQSPTSRVLAFAIIIASRLDVSRVLEWAARTRELGAYENCPLIVVAGDADNSTHKRVVAAAAAHGAFADERARELVERAACDVGQDEVRQVLLDLNELAPDLLPSFVTGALTTHRSATLVAGALHALGAVEQADAVTAYVHEHWPSAPARTLV